MATKIILPNDPESAELVTAKFWKSRRGNYYLEKDERLAMWDGATHIKCECGNIVEKYWTKCSQCRRIDADKKYASLEKVDWDGETPLCIFGGDQYFYDIDEIQEYCDNNNISLGDLKLVLCERVKPPMVDVSDLFCDFLPENCDDSDIPKEVWDAANEFNQVLAKHSPAAWIGSLKAVKL